MSEPVAGGSADVAVDYHMFYLAEPEQIDSAPPPVEAANGLISSRPGLAIIHVGASSGLVHLTVEVHQAAPPVAVSEGWEETVDHSFEALTGETRVIPLMQASPDLPLLTPFGPGFYRLRVCANGRDTEPDAVAFRPLEHYLVAAWPDSALRPDTIHRQADQYGASLRRSAATRGAQQAEDWPHAPSQHQRLLDDNLRRVVERRERAERSDPPAS